MARRSHGRVFTRPAPRTSIWLGMGLAATNVTAATTATLLATYASFVLLLRPFTIVRTRMIVSIVSDQSTSTEFIQGALGMQVVTEAAAAAGAASVPTPETEPGADYFVYQPWFNSFVLKTAVGFTEHGQSGTWHVDSKAMRKVDIDDDLAVTIEGLSSNGYNISIEGRQLIKLH